MVTPFGPVHSKGTVTSSWPLASTKSWLSPTSLKPLAAGTGMVLSSLIQPLTARYGWVASSVSRRTGGLPSSLVCGNCSSSASSTVPPSSTRRRTSVVMVTRAGPASVCAAGCAAGREPSAWGTGAPGMLPAAAPGTLAWVVWVATAGVGGAALSRPHSIHSNTATISQAKIRKTRVWFISVQARRGRHAMPARTGKGVQRPGAAALCRPRPAWAMRQGGATGVQRPGGVLNCWRYGRHCGQRRRNRRHSSTAVRGVWHRATHASLGCDPRLGDRLCATPQDPTWLAYRSSASAGSSADRTHGGRR